VVNLDLPWNPARLEQRIARAWRKHQTRSVQVIHLVTEESIEQRMQGLLAGKQALADGVLDGRGVDEMPMPSGRAAFMERLEEILELRLTDLPGRPAGEAEAAPDVPAPERLRQDLSALLGERLLLLDLQPRRGLRHPAQDTRSEAAPDQLTEPRSPATVLAVVDRLEGAAGERSAGQAGAAAGSEIEAEIQAAVGRCFGEGPGAPRLELLDRATYETVRRLADAGVLQLAPGIDGADGADDIGGEPLYRSPALSTTSNRREELRRRRLAEARDHLAAAERKLRLTRLLAGHDFGAEAVAPLAASLSEGLLGLARFAGIEGESALEVGERLEERFGPLAVEGVKLLGLLEAMRSEGLEDTAPDRALEGWVEKGETLLRSIEGTFDRAALGGRS